MLRRSIVLLLALQPLLACSSAGPDNSAAEAGASAVSTVPAGDNTVGDPGTQPAQRETELVEPESNVGGGGGAEPNPMVEGPPQVVDPDAPALLGDGGARGAEAAGDPGSGGSPDAPEVENSGGAGAGNAEPAGNCAGMVDGLYCGDELTIAGASQSVYICVSAEVVDIAPCSGKCSYGFCDAGNGSSEGAAGESGEENCTSCESAKCTDETMACMGDEVCTAVLSCARACPSQACVEACEASHEPSIQYDALNRCGETRCGKYCK